MAIVWTWLKESGRHNALNSVNNSFQKVIKQISTGLRVNSAADLAISENLRAQTLGLDRAVKNAQDGISLLQTAEGALGETNSMLQRMRELAVQAANDTLTSQDRNFLQMEIDELKANIDRIADTTQFNTKRLLDGSCCGTISSTDAGTKGYIHGAFDIEGNYRIEIKANPGTAQVQKVGIFRIKHENVVTNAQTNSDNGIGQVQVDNMPAGDYTVTATKTGGGEVTTTYTYTSTISFEHENTSGITESLNFRLSGTNSETGAAVNTSFTVSIPKDASKDDISQLIASQLNDKIITMGSGNNLAHFTLKAETDGNGNCTITSTSTEGKLSQITFSASKNSTTQSNINTTHSNTDTYERSMTGKANAGNESNTDLKITITDGGFSGEFSVSGITANMTAEQITAAIQNIGSQPVTLTNGSGESKSITIMGQVASTPDYYTLTVSGGSSQNLNLSLSQSNFDNAVQAVKRNSNYTATGNGTVTAGNSSTETEKLRVYLSRYSSSNSDSNAYFEIDVEPGDDEAKIAQAIAEAAKKKGMMTVGSNKVFLESSYTSGSSCQLQAIGAGENLYFRTSISSTSIPNKNFETKESYSAAYSLTGFYGDSSAASSLSANVNAQTQNNASILFEVTASAIDETGKGTITLKSSSSVLTTGGETRNYSDSKIIVSTGNKTVNLGSLLGEDAGNFSITLNPEKFSIGGNGTNSQPADTSLYINSKNDPSEPKKMSFISMSILKLSPTGNYTSGAIALTVNEDFGTSAKNLPAAPIEGEDRTKNEIALASFTANYVGQIASRSTKLRDIENFWTKSGIFMLQEPQTITISQNDGRKASITLNASDTIEDLRRKLNDAISEDLGQGFYTSRGDMNNLVTFVDNP